MNTGLSFWTSQPPERALGNLGSTPQGLSAAEAAARLKTYGPNRIKAKKKIGIVLLFLSQFKSPIILILLFPALVAILVLYILSAEVAKRIFYKKIKS